MTHYNVSFAGAGRVAGALCKAMHSSGMTVRQIVSETPSRGRVLAARYDASWSSEPVFADPVDIIVVAVPDHRLAGVLSTMECPATAIVAHTAGSYGFEVFPERMRNRGIFYPLQTFSENRRINFKDLPFFIEAEDERTSSILKTAAEMLGGKVFLADAVQRRMLHLAAVFTCNFVNHMLTAGKEITVKSGLPFEVMEPLIRETVSKALKNGPELSQTGPALRNDMNTIEKHLELLSFSPDLRKIYSEVTRSIIEYYKQNR